MSFGDLKLHDHSEHFSLGVNWNGPRTSSTTNHKFYMALGRLHDPWRKRPLGLYVCWLVYGSTWEAKVYWDLARDFEVMVWPCVWISALSSSVEWYMNVGELKFWMARSFVYLGFKLLACVRRVLAYQLRCTSRWQRGVGVYLMWDTLYGCEV